MHENHYVYGISQGPRKSGAQLRLGIISVITFNSQRNVFLPFWSPSFLRFGVFLWGVSKYLPHVITVHEQGKSKDENGKGCVKPKRDLE